MPTRRDDLSAALKALELSELVDVLAEVKGHLRHSEQVLGLLDSITQARRGEVVEFHDVAVTLDELLA